MRRLARVFFQVRALDADAHVSRQHHEAIDVDRLVVLADLIGLRHVLVEVVLAVKRAWLHCAIERKTKANCQLHCVLVENRERAGKAKCYRVDIGVWLVTKMVWTCGKQLGLRIQFHVHFEPNNHLPAVW